MVVGHRVCWPSYGVRTAVQLLAANHSAQARWICQKKIGHPPPLEPHISDWARDGSAAAPPRRGRVVPAAAAPAESYGQTVCCHLAHCALRRVEPRLPWRARTAARNDWAPLPRCVHRQQRARATEADACRAPAAAAPAQERRRRGRRRRRQPGREPVEHPRGGHPAVGEGAAAVRVQPHWSDPDPEHSLGGPGVSACSACSVCPSCAVQRAAAQCCAARMTRSRSRLLTPPAPSHTCRRRPGRGSRRHRTAPWRRPST